VEVAGRPGEGRLFSLLTLMASNASAGRGLDGRDGGRVPGMDESIKYWGLIQLDREAIAPDLFARKRKGGGEIVKSLSWRTGLLLDIM